MSAHEQTMDLKARMERSIIGQDQVVERLLLTLLCNGNVLVEGLPGLAKTRAVKSLAKLLRKTDRTAEEKSLLSGVYDRFEEGFDTADIDDAKALLGSL
jgi:MoxR-like ATPase